LGVKEVIDPDPGRYYYSIVSVLEHNAYPNHVVMIKALELTGKEDAKGVVRYTNSKQNVVIDVITSAKSPYYEGFGYDLENMTKFTKHPSLKRLQFGHLELIPFSMKRFQSTAFHDSLKN